MLPLGAGDDFLDSWLQFTCASRDENGQLPQKRGASSEFIVRTLQVRDAWLSFHCFEALVCPGGLQYFIMEL